MGRLERNCLRLDPPPHPPTHPLTAVVAINWECAIDVYRV